MFQSLKDRQKDDKDKLKFLQGRENDQKDKLKLFQGRENDQKDKLKIFQRRENEQKDKLTIFQGRENDQKDKLKIFQRRENEQKDKLTIFQSRETDQKDKLTIFQSRETDQKDKSKVFKPPKLKGSSTNWGLKGFICCYFVGVGSIILGVYVSFLPFIGTQLFIGLYAFGNIFALFSTLFLVGPVKQLTRMCDMSRVLATFTMLACIVLTPFAALLWNSYGLTMLFCALHILSFSWYSLSFTPCVRKFLKMFSLIKL